MRSPAANRRVLINSLHHLPPNSVAIRRTNPNKWIELTVGVRRLKQLPDLSALEAKRPDERQYMTRDQLRTEYGSDPAAIAKIEKFAADHHLVVTRNEPASARLGIAGTVANVSQAFGVKLLNYKHPKLGDFHARTGPVTLPAEVARAITGVFGLNNHRVMHRLPRPGRRSMPLRSFAKTRPWFIPTELAGIYNFPDADARSQCIGLLEFGGGVKQSDVTAYFQRSACQRPTFRSSPSTGSVPIPPPIPNSTGEVMLDVDIAGALAGGAKVAVYFSTFDEKGLVDILSTVINDQTNDPSVLSVSWGWDENQPFNNGILWSAAAIEHVNHSLLAVAHLGITVCVSTGDDGSEAQIQDGHAHVNFPATSPYVLAVGGTTLHARKGTNEQMAVTEVVWNDGPGSGGGGGVSDITPIPSWQEGKVPRSINPGSFAGRAIPDVAANADPNTGYLVMNGGQFGIVGGTSASAPLWASLVSRINALNGARAGNFNALLYTNIGPAGALRDITSGNNDTDGLLDGQFQAGPGWDACTGWGAPDGIKLLAALKSPTS